MSRSHALLFAALLVGAPHWACTGRPPQGQERGPAVADTAALGEHFVVRASPLNMQPTDAPIVPHPHDPAQTRPNTVAMLKRGQRVVVGDTQSGWAQLTTADGAHGWAPRAALMATATTCEATVLVPTPLYPDIAAATPVATLPTGTQLFVVSRGPRRSAVHVPEDRLGYVDSAGLTSDPREVGISQLLVRVPGLKPHKAPKLVAEARRKYAGAALMATLTARLAALPPAPGPAPLPDAQPPP